MGPYVDSVTPDEAMPAATGVVVIGGGIIGASAALALAAACGARDPRRALREGPHRLRAIEPQLGLVPADRP